MITAHFCFLHSTKEVPESIPFQRQIWQELLDVQVKALNPSQKAAR